MVLSTKSVVSIAAAAAIAAAGLAASESTNGLIPASNKSIGIGTPITPVEQIKTSSSTSPN